MNDNFLIRNAGLCLFVWMTFLVGGYLFTIDSHPYFARGWMVIFGGVFVACLTALLAFDNMEKNAIRNKKTEQYFAYYELLTCLQEWLQYSERIRGIVESSIKVNDHSRVFAHSKIMVGSDFPRIDFSKIVFINNATSSEYTNASDEPENYDCFNIGSLSALEHNFFGLVSILKDRNEVYDKHIKQAATKSTNKNSTFSIDNAVLKTKVSYVDFTDYIQLTEGMFSLSDQLVRHLGHLMSQLLLRADEVLDLNIANENGGLPKIYKIVHRVDLDIKYIKLPDSEHLKLRAIYD